MQHAMIIYKISKTIMSVIFSFKNKIISGNSRSVAIKKNIIFSILIKGVSIAVSFLLVPLTLGYVNSELYGIWLTISSLVSWIHFLDVGFTNGLKNRLGESIAMNNWERGKALVTTTYSMMFFIFIPLCIILVVCTPFINWAGGLNINPEYNDAVRDAMYVLVVCFCLQMILNVLTAVIAAYQRVALSSSFIVIGNFLSLCIIFVLTKCCQPSLLALAFAISAMPVIVLLIASFYFYSGKFKQVAPSIKTYNRKYVNDLFRLGAKFFIIQIQMLILYQTTNVLISNISGPKDVTSYNLAYKYIGIAMMVYTIFLQPLWPAFTDAYTKKDYVWMKNIYDKMTKVFLLCVLVIVLMVMISPFVYKIWIGDKAEVPFVMTVTVAIYVLVHSWDALQVNMINGTGKIKLQTYVTLVGLLVHIPLALFLSKFTGAIGVVLSMICVTLFYSIVFTTQINKLIRQKANGVWGT